MEAEYENDDLSLQNLSLQLKCVSDVVDLLKENLERKKIAFGISDQDIFELAHSVVSQSGIVEDTIRFAKTDPAAKNSWPYVYNSYRGIKAMMYYRVAHSIYNWNVLENVDRGAVVSLVRDMSERGKVETGIEIHPLAEIGKGCVIDHGIGTKIMGGDYDRNTIIVGETTIIGDNCTILNDVVIGADTVNEGMSIVQRHPIIGNGVTICAGVKLFGGIHIGDNVFIAPGCRIEHDIPSNTKVLIINQIQIMSNKEEEQVKVDGIVFDGTELLLYGENIKNAELQLINDQYIERTDFSINVSKRSNYYISFTIKKKDGQECEGATKYTKIKVTVGTKYFYVSSRVIGNFLDHL